MDLFGNKKKTEEIKACINNAKLELKKYLVSEISRINEKLRRIEELSEKTSKKYIHEEDLDKKRPSFNQIMDEYLNGATPKENK